MQFKRWVKFHKEGRKGTEVRIPGTLTTKKLEEGKKITLFKKGAAPEIGKEKKSGEYYNEIQREIQETGI